MTSPVFKKTIFISLLGHITAFSILSLSFGNRIPKVEYSGVSFWGQILLNSQVTEPAIARTKVNPPPLRPGVSLTRYYFPAKAGSRPMFPAMRDPVGNLINGRENEGWEKPQLTLTFNTQKASFAEKPKTLLVSSRRKEPTIIFHPLLPYGFTLYFKDREVAHVELMFKIVSSRERDSIVIKRKISSGNLEVDLLTLRYIGHYLFIQQPSFIQNGWQTVKIDLSAKND